MKKYLLMLIVFLVTGLSANAQETPKNKTSVILDGKRIPLGMEGVKNLNPTDVEQVTVIKERAKTKLFGIDDNNGLVVFITKSKKNSSENAEVYKKLAKLGLNKKPMADNSLNPKPSRDSIPNGTFDFVSIEKQPQFPGGLQSFYQYLSRNIKYPKEDVKNKVQGKVFMSFVVEKDGRLTDIHVVRGVSPQIDDEAVRVISASPKWHPGIQFGVPVRVKYNINVNFKL